MRYYFAIAALCLLGTTCRAQTKPAAVAALSPRPVRLDSGYVVRVPMAGFTRQEYEALLAEQAEAQRFVLVTTQRLISDRARRRTDSLAAVTYSNEIRRLRQERTQGYARESRLELQLDKVLSRPRLGQW